MKDPVTRMKRQTVEWEQLFVNHISDKGVVSQIYKDLSKLNRQKANYPIRTWPKGMSRYFTRECLQMANKHMKRCSA